MHIPGLIARASLVDSLLWFSWLFGFLLEISDGWNQVPFCIFKIAQYISSHVIISYQSKIGHKIVNY